MGIYWLVWVYGEWHYVVCISAAGVAAVNAYVTVDNEHCCSSPTEWPTCAMLPV